MSKAGKPIGPAPTRSDLYETALRYLARFAATELGLLRVLNRRVQRWAQAATAAGDMADISVPLAAARDVARTLAIMGIVDDRAFAAARANQLTRSGHSRRVTDAHLAGKGVSAEFRARALPEDDLAAATVFVRRRRFGPFGSRSDDAALRRELAAMARAGFCRDMAERALNLTREEAEAILLAIRQR